MVVKQFKSDRSGRVTEIELESGEVLNDPAIIVKNVAPVNSDTPAGAVASGTKVTLSCATEGAVIFYTTDGSNPDMESSRYSSKITISADKTIKAVAYKDGCLAAPVETFEYTIAS